MMMMMMMIVLCSVNGLFLPVECSSVFVLPASWPVGLSVGNDCVSVYCGKTADSIEMPVEALVGLAGLRNYVGLLDGVQIPRMGSCKFCEEMVRRMCRVKRMQHRPCKNG